MEQKHIIITGGYSGIGLELTRLILKENHKVGLIIRNEKTLKEARTIFNDHGDDIDFFIADLSDQKNIADVSDEIKNRWQKIDLLFNNAGVLLGEKILSLQKNEMHYEVNTLAPYLLINNLHSLLVNANGALVINSATDGLNMMKELKAEELINPVKFKKLFGSYIQSKLALVLMMNDLAGKLKQHNIRILNVSPGGNKTRLSKGNGMPVIFKPMVNLFYKNPAIGAGLLYEAGFGNKFKDATGMFIQKNKIENLRAVLSEKQKLALLNGLINSDALKNNLN